VRRERDELLHDGRAAGPQPLAELVGIHRLTQLARRP
jgi:hypothetical protein